MRLLAVAMIVLSAASCGGERKQERAAPPAQVSPAADVDDLDIDALGERFVKLGLALGKYDKPYVDAYHGPEAWAQSVDAAPPTLEALEKEASDIIATISGTRSDPRSPRRAALSKAARAALMRIRMTKGEKYSFDAETREIYGVVAPAYSVAEFDAALAEVDARFPGEGALAGRVDAFRNSLSIPADRLKTVFDAAIAECRRRTLARYKLPENERFTMRFVTDKPWSGYNWYQGDNESVIEINTDLPISIDRAVDLGCHEGYPGHHAWNVLIERDLVVKNGWVEFSMYPLFSPQSLIAEGAANYGVDLAFPGDEKLAFEKSTLYPLAGLDPEKAQTLDALRRLERKLSHSRNHVARAYLDGEIAKDEAIAMIMKYSLVSRERAEQSVKFIETYRGYVINYNLGRDLVEAHIDREVANGVDRWDAFEALLTNPDAAGVVAAR